MKITIPTRTIEIAEEHDVIVAGGGPAGIGAAVAAAREGADVLLLEKRGFLGGNITACYVETVNHMLNNCPFRVSGLYAELERRYTEMFGPSDDIRSTIPMDSDSFRFHSEYFKVFCDRLMREEKIAVKYHAFVNEVVLNDTAIDALIVQTKKGPLACKARLFIDATGDGDIAFAAGVPFDQGSALPQYRGLNQAATMNLRVAGADVARIRSLPNGLNSVSLDLNRIVAETPDKAPVERDWIALGRLTGAGQISYCNSADIYQLDPTDIDDMTKGEIEGREKALKLFYFLKQNGQGCSSIELASFAPELGFRDSRRIRGAYTLTKEDIEARRKFDDCIAVFPRFYDMTSLDGIFDKSRGFDGSSLFIRAADPTPYHIPYRCIQAQGVSNLLTAGRCISADHLAESSIRAIYTCMCTGQAAGAAAAIACANGSAPANIDIRQLQSTLRNQGAVLE